MLRAVVRKVPYHAKIVLALVVSPGALAYVCPLTCEEIHYQLVMEDESLLFDHKCESSSCIHGGKFSLGGYCF